MSSRENWCKYFHGTLSLGYKRRFTSDGLGCRSVRNRKVLSWFPDFIYNSMDQKICQVFPLKKPPGGSL